MPGSAMSWQDTLHGKRDEAQRLENMETFKHIKAVVWDVGGVIVRTVDPSPRSKLSAELGVTLEKLNTLFFSGPEGVQAQKGAISVGKLVASVRQHLGLKPGEFPDLMERFFGGDQVDYELVAFIRSLKPRYKTGIISNAWRNLPRMLETWGIRDAFDMVISSGDEGIMKPDPQIFQLALARLSVRADETVFIDDFIENVEAARNLGFQAIHFRNREQALIELGSILNDE